MNELQVQTHLDHAGVAYLFSIGSDMSEKLQPFIETFTGNTIVSVGFGDGKELTTLRKTFPHVQVIGADLSQVALTHAREQNPNLVAANVVRLPFQSNSVDGVILSSILHEVYSYSFDGYEAWRQAVNEAARITRVNGTVFIRDPAAPDSKERVEVFFRTPQITDFYDYFAHFYRRFDTPGMLSVQEFPERQGNRVSMTLPQVAEMAMHFRNFDKDLVKKETYLGDRDWKEIRESYFIGSRLSPQEYIKKIEAVAPLKLKQLRIEDRPQTQEFLEQHLTILGSAMSTDLLADCIRKMSLVMRKVDKPKTL